MKLTAPWFGSAVSRFAIRRRLKASPAPRLLTFAQAEEVGHALHDHWEKMAGKAPLSREDMGWGDIVQFVIREARNVAAEADNGR